MESNESCVIMPCFPLIYNQNRKQAPLPIMSGALRHNNHNSLSGKRGTCNEIWRRTGYQKEGSREGDQGYGDPLPGKANETGFGIEQEA